MNFSIIIPVYDRPDELEELLQSIVDQGSVNTPEVVVVEDGSRISSAEIVKKFSSMLNIKYLEKENSGPGLSRNYGMSRANGDYFIILDSDCLLSDHYLDEVSKCLEVRYTDAFGGPDAAHPSFTLIQQAISYAMTSFLSTGGLRNTESEKKKFQLRSFNMGISKETFIRTKGFAAQRFGEDIEFTNRLWAAGLTTQFLPKTFVYHKRRTSWNKFFRQVYNFGAARPVLGDMYPKMKGLSYWFPILFVILFIISLLLLAFGYHLPIFLFLLYFALIFLDATLKGKGVILGITSVIAVFIQFFGYGLGFFSSVIKLRMLGKSTKEAFPIMFND